MLSRPAKDDFQKAQQAAFRLLKVRPRSKAELRRRLKEKKIPPEQRERLISEWEEKGLLNDEEFAYWWAKNRWEKGWAKRVIHYQLKEKGIAAEIEEKVFLRLEKEIAKKGVLEKLFKMRWQKLKGEKDPAKKRRRIFGFFLRRGFSYSEIAQVWEENT